MNSLSRGLLVIVALVAAPVVWSQSPLGDLHWRLIGPFRGGRALAVTGVPGQPEKFYFGGVGGGVWVTENAGRTWTPIFDKVPVASIGAIAVAPSDPNVIYVGTGEADMRSDIQQGSGMYKSIDAGTTWQQIGLEDTRQIGKILVDPNDANTIYVAALGHQYGPNSQRGVFKTTDGGKTWTKSLYKNPDVGAIDMAMDPTDSNVIFATMWQTRRPPWSIYPPSNGPGSGLYRSTDAGETWKQITGGGFPSFVGRVGITISPADHNRVYAILDTTLPKKGGVYRSNDGGDTWTHTDGEDRIWGRGWYFAGITADPKDADVFYVMNTSTYRSSDGGKTFTPIKGAPGGDDYHALWIYPDDPKRMILGCDQGVIVSVDGAKTWSSWYNQPTGQFYHVITDNRFPYWVYGAQQDSGAMAVPSRTIHTGIGAMDSRPIDVGGESGTIAPDPLHPGLLFGNGGNWEQLDTAWEQDRNPLFMHPETNWRSTWTTPIVASPIEPHVFYLSHQQIFRTENAGASWTIISPDLSRKTTTVPPNLDATTIADNDGSPRRGVVYWISPSPVEAHELWASTDDGLIWLTRDEGKHWQDVTPPALTPWSKVGTIDASHFDPNTAFAAVDRHRLDDNSPYIYRTRDGGAHWTLITHGLPTDQWVNVVKEDPKRAGLLYAGTERGVYVSLDAGAHWYSLQFNLPAASVRDIVFGGNDVVVGTHGRAIWILDDASVLRQTRKPIGNETRLFKPSAAVLFQRAGTFGFGMFDEGTPFPPEEPQGQNPVVGANIDYALGQGSGAVVFRVVDAHGRVVRRLTSTDAPEHIDLKTLDIPAYWVHPKQPPSSETGVHRLLWDLHYQNEGGPHVPPGPYTVQMSVNGKTYSQPLTVVRDPRLPVTDADLRAQFEFSLAIRDEAAVVEALKQQFKKLPSADRGKLVALSKRLQTASAILGGLQGAVDSAPSAPATEQVATLQRIKVGVAADRVILLRFSK